jgi:pyruvate/2-oxoacid:ferredoxin oxidoreductase beta subunit
VTSTHTRQDFQTDQDVRWCPGCGDYTILSSVQNFMAGLDIPRENIVFTGLTSPAKTSCLFPASVALLASRTT